MEWAPLDGLSDEEIAQVLALGRPRRFARREVVWHEGDRADTMHFVTSGQIAVQTTTPLGEVATAAVWGPGQAAGLIDAHGSDPYHTTSAVALQATETLAIRIDELAQVRRRYPAINDALIRLLADKIIDLVAQLVDAHYVPADIRVLRRVVALADLYDRGDAEIVIPLTQEDLAEIAGATRPTVNRVLRKEDARGTIGLSRGAIKILDLERLRVRIQ